MVSKFINLCVKIVSICPIYGHNSLGVILDSKLSWKPHLAHLTEKFNCALYL